MTISKRAAIAKKGLGVAMKEKAVLSHEGGRRFYYRAISPEARLKKKKARKQARKSKRRKH